MGPQFFNIVEFAFSPDAIDEIYRDVFSIQVPAKIEDIYLAGNLPVIADRGPDSDIKHPVENFLFDNYFYGIHANGW